MIQARVWKKKIIAPDDRPYCTGGFSKVAWDTCVLFLKLAVMPMILRKPKAPTKCQIQHPSFLDKKHYDKTRPNKIMSNSLGMITKITYQYDFIIRRVRNTVIITI